MIVSIGMLARNEESHIAHTIRSLFQQSVFSSHEQTVQTTQWELIVVPNGCSDATAQVATETLAQCLASLSAKNVTTSVIELSAPGKSNAWNRYIHDFSRKDADLIVMVDSDVEFDHPDTIYNSIKEISSNGSADVVVDLPLKNILKKENKTLLEKISIRLSQERLEGSPGIAGSFYCGRAQVLRRIWMPVGLSGEDGFLRAMIITDLFRSEVDARRVVRAKNASHFYKASTDFAQVFKHELRLVIGTTLNCYFTWDFLKFATDPNGPGAGLLIKNCLENDPDWYKKFIHNEIRNRGWWVIPRGMLFRRFTGLRDMTLRDKLKRMPLALLVFLFELSVFLAANSRLKKGGAIGFW